MRPMSRRARAQHSKTSPRINSLRSEVSNAGPDKALAAASGGWLRPQADFCGALPDGDFWERTERPGTNDTARGIVVHVLGREDPLRRLPPLDPVHQGRQGIEAVGPRAGATVQHTGDHEQP